MANLRVVFKRRQIHQTPTSGHIIDRLHQSLIAYSACHKIDERPVPQTSIVLETGVLIEVSIYIKIAVLGKTSTYEVRVLNCRNNHVFR